MHNLIKIGDLVTPQSDAVQIMSMVMKDISPKWRMMFVRKLFQAGKAHLVFPSFPIFVHNFGKICHPLVKELLSDEILNTEAYIELSKVSGGILCALNKKTRLRRIISDQNDVTEEIFCSICQSDCQTEETSMDR